MIKFEPRPHQQDMLWSMDMNDKGIVHCPVGGGKTYTFITDSRKYLIDNPIKTSCNELKDKRLKCHSQEKEL